MHLRPLIRAALASVAVLLCLSIQAAAQSYSIDAHVIAAGTPARSGSAGFRLDATGAEPAAVGAQPAPSGCRPSSRPSSSRPS